MIPFRFTLRIALLSITMMAVGMMLASLKLRQYQRIAADTKWLESVHASVELCSPGRFSLPRLARGFDGHPIRVSKHSDRPALKHPDNFIDVIARNPTIESIYISGSPLSDAQVRRILALPMIKIGIGQCSTGDTLHAPASPTLQWLSFFRTRINDAALRSLGPLSKVKYLDLTRTRVSDESIDYLAKLPALKTLKIQRCKITRAGKERLTELRPDVQVRWETL